MMKLRIMSIAEPTIQDDQTARRWQEVVKTAWRNSMFQLAKVIGWVELREINHESRELLGLVKLDPPYV
jgi:hypothetical protein